MVQQLKGTSRFDSRYHPTPIGNGTALVEALALAKLLQRRCFTFEQLTTMMEITPDERREVAEIFGEAVADACVDFRTRGEVESSAVAVLVIGTLNPSLLSRSFEIFGNPIGTTAQFSLNSKN